MKHVVMIKTLLYTGVRVSELVNIKLSDIDLDNCQIKVVQGKGKKDRIVPFPNSFKEILAVHVENSKKMPQNTYLSPAGRKIILTVALGKY